MLLKARPKYRAASRFAPASPIGTSARAAVFLNEENRHALTYLQQVLAGDGRRGRSPFAARQARRFPAPIRLRRWRRAALLWHGLRRARRPHPGVPEVGDSRSADGERAVHSRDARG